MKKYQQLILLIVSLISLSLLLIYRHEYNRLHYVLEVFNFFGQPCNFSDLQVSENILGHHDWGPEPLWQENENNYIYSAFWDKKNEAKVIIVQSDRNEISRNCYLWFEDKKKPVFGKFKYSKIDYDEKLSLFAYFYYCAVPNYDHTPYAVSFTTKTKKPSELKKILLTNTFSNKAIFNTTVCVLPSMFRKFEFIEFLSFHKLIGIDSFIFYSNDIPHRLTKIILNLSNRLGLKVTFFPWNFPKMKSSLTRKIIENDCILRTLNESRNVITLETNEYIVPSKYQTFNEIMTQFDAKLERVSLPVQIFCIQNFDHRKPIALQNTVVSYTDDKLVYDVIRKVQESNLINTQAIDKQYAAVHKYTYCTQRSERNYSDRTILKYSTDFLRSTLVQLLLHSQI